MEKELMEKDERIRVLTAMVAEQQSRRYESGIEFLGSTAHNDGMQYALELKSTKLTAEDQEQMNLLVRPASVLPANHTPESRVTVTEHESYRFKSEMEEAGLKAEDEKTQYAPAIETADFNAEDNMQEEAMALQTYMTQAVQQHTAEGLRSKHGKSFISLRHMC
jgi:hypothetical protein